MTKTKCTEGRKEQAKLNKLKHKKDLKMDIAAFLSFVNRLQRGRVASKGEKKRITKGCREIHNREFQNL
jgi:hypothetical protein